MRITAFKRRWYKHQIQNQLTGCQIKFNIWGIWIYCKMLYCLHSWEAKLNNHNGFIHKTITISTKTNIKKKKYNTFNIYNQSSWTKYFASLMANCFSCDHMSSSCVLVPDDCRAGNTTETAEWDKMLFRLMNLNITHVNLYIKSICKSKVKLKSSLTSVLWLCITMAMRFLWRHCCWAS